MSLLRTRALTALIGSVLIAVAVPSTSASAKGIDDLLCGGHRPGRVTVAANFALDACFSGTELHLKNRTNLVLRITTTGNVGTPTRTRPVLPPIPTVIAELLSDLGSAPFSTLPPADEMVIPVGSGAAAMTLEADAKVSQYYLWASLLLPALTALPTGIGQLVNFYDSVATLIQALDREFADFERCMTSSGNFIGSAACSLGFTTQASWSLGVFGVSVALGGANLDAWVRVGTKVLVEGLDKSSWTLNTAEDVKNLLADDSARKLSIAAVSPTVAVPGGSAGSPAGGRSGQNPPFHCITGPGSAGSGCQPGSPGSGPEPTPQTTTTSASPPPTDQSPPQITQSYTYREGNLVYIQLFFTDADIDAVGFGFRGVNGSWVGEESHLFTDPSYGKVSPGEVDYPFNLGCTTSSPDQTDVEAWIYDQEGARSSSVQFHLVCPNLGGAP